MILVFDTHDNDEIKVRVQDNLNKLGYAWASGVEYLRVEGISRYIYADEEAMLLSYSNTMTSTWRDTKDIYPPIDCKFLIEDLYQEALAELELEEAEEPAPVVRYTISNSIIV